MDKIGRYREYFFSLWRRTKKKKNIRFKNKIVLI